MGADTAARPLAPAGGGVPVAGRRVPLLPLDAVLAWLAARAAVLVALGLTTMLALPGRRGLLGWDADHYLAIARRGYPLARPEEARFFPLVPLLARALGALPLVPLGVALLVVANVGALAYGVLLQRFLLAEGEDDATASATAWLVALAPPAFVLVMGYAESVYGVLLVGYLAAVRRGRWLPAALVGVLAGTCRPFALVLVAVGAVEAVRGVRAAGWAAVPARLAAVAGPAVGTGAYLLWTGLRTGDPLLPFRVQADSGLRGSVVADPVASATRLVRGALSGDTVGSGLHVAWLLLFLVLLVVVACTMPLSYTVLTALTLLLAATSGALESLERYGWTAFPLVLAVARAVRRPPLLLLTVAASTVGLVAYSTLTFAARYVP
jgi:hypothetical protein